MASKHRKTSRSSGAKRPDRWVRWPTPSTPDPYEQPTWNDARKTFMDLAKLESKQIRLRVIALIDAVDKEALDVFRVARRLERKTYLVTQQQLADYGRRKIVERLREKFATDLVKLANTDILDEKLEKTPSHWRRQGELLLDCAEALTIQFTFYEVLLGQRRKHEGGRSPSVAYDYLAAEQDRFDLDDDQVTQSLIEAGFIRGDHTFMASFRENVIKRHRLRWLKRNAR